MTVRFTEEVEADQYQLIILVEPSCMHVCTTSGNGFSYTSVNKCEKLSY